MIEAMTSTMINRGPDAGGVWCSVHAAIGHRRLSVIDLEGGEQPMRAALRHSAEAEAENGTEAEDEVVLTFSGEVYNFTELRTELTARGHHFRTRSDTEVVLHAYLQWGADCVTRLNGMFAFAIWDGRRQELLLARDRLGVKPLYYAKLPDGVLFGSEPKAILAHPGFRPRSTPKAWPSCSPRSAPRRQATASTGACPRSAPARSSRSAASASGRPRTGPSRRATTPTTSPPRPRTSATSSPTSCTARPSPTCRCAACSPAASTRASSPRWRRDSLQRRDRTKLATFSVDFAGSADAFTPDQLRPSHDEPFARAAAEHIGSRHGTVLLTADDLVEAQWAPLTAHDLPTMGDMWVSMYLLSQEIRQQSTVALSGESADEVFGGYPWYHAPALLAAPTFPWAFRGSWAPLLTEQVREAIRLDEYAADRYAQAVKEVPRLAGESPQDRRIREVLYLGLTRWLPLLLDRKDRLSMACGLEVRVPFTDHRLVEYVWNVPWAMKEAGGIEKGLLRTAAAGLLPPDLLNRRKSIYPGAADQAYERAIDAQLRDLLQKPSAPLFDLVDHNQLAEAYARDPRLTGFMAIQPSSTTPIAFLLDINRWLDRSGVTIRLDA